MRASGDVVLAAGDVETPIFWRSAAKPFIAAAAIEAGAREAFGLEMHEVAVMAASHFGEPFHVEAVLSVLRKIGLDESALQCGAHAPYDEASAQALAARGEQPSALHNNCSGKHAGILALARLLGADTATYLRLDHPAQQAILAFCGRVCGEDPAAWPLGVDGCGIPVFATSLRTAAFAFARFAALSGLNARDAAALLVVRDAMVSFPHYVAGTAQFDSELMRVCGGEIACKVGAEGVHGVAAMTGQIGFASKVIDGSNRGRAPVTVAALESLGVLSRDQAIKLASFAAPLVYNRAGKAVGEVRARRDLLSVRVGA